MINFSGNYITKLFDFTLLLDTYENWAKNTIKQHFRWMLNIIGELQDL